MLKLAGISAIAAAACILTISPAAAKDATPASEARNAQVHLIATSHTASRNKKKKKTAAPAVVQTAPRAVWTGPDPSKGPGIERMRAEQRAGRCVIDEGYGRFTYCTDR
jgi:hypothetical protein